jgi:transcriptional regulator with XRE-family HTH domain
MRSAHILFAMSIDVMQRSLTERVAEEIRVLMLRRGVQGGELARTLGVSAAWVSYRLTGKQPIDLNDLERIANVLEVQPLDLLRAAVEGITLREPSRPPRQPHVSLPPLPRRPDDNRPSAGPGRSGPGRNRTSRTRPPYVGAA